MSSEPRLSRLVEQTSAALARAAVEEEGLRERQPAAPGDLFVHRATAGWPLEWLLLQLHGGRAHVVPADSFAAFASSDLLVEPHEPGGPLTLRAAHSAWIDASQLDLDRRSGRVARAAVERVRFLVERAAASAAPSTGGDDEAASWQAELDAALAALLAAAPAAERAAPRRRSGGTRFFAIAASVALVASAVLVGRLAMVATSSMERLEREQRRAAATRADLDAARRSLAAKQRQLDTASAALTAVRAREQENQRQTPLARINVPFLWLAADETLRGEATTLTVPAGSELVMLIVPLVEPSRFARYRAELLRDGKVLWQAEELVPTGVAELSFALPQSLLPRGDYQLRVGGLGAAGATPVSTFRFRVATSVGAQRQSP
jgi:hypothetical protein